MQSNLWLSHWRFISISVLLLFVGPLLVLGQQEEAKQSQISEEEAIGALTFFVFTVVIGVLVGSVIRFLHLPYTAILIVSRDLPHCLIAYTQHQPNILVSKTALSL